MDALTRAAVAGTSREAPPAGGLPTDDLLEDKVRSPEKDLLLRAGMHAVYRAAGRRTEAGVEAPETAPEETLPACSAKAAEVIRQLFAGRRYDILREALERLRLAGLRLPHSLLPAALDVQEKESRRAVAAVLGERGRWLAGFNPDWAWATALAMQGTEKDDDVAWQESALPERLAVLRRIRGRDANEGRLLVEDAWKSEKAEARAAFVEAMETSLSSNDESFLERALDDRSVRVREAAAALLARLPGSAYTGRMVARADAILIRYEPAAGLLGGGRGGLVVELPEDFDASWNRDLPGSDKPPYWVGAKAWRMINLLASVSPDHWEERFGVGPYDLVAAASGDWEAALLAGWCRAAERHGDGSWALQIWEKCLEQPEFVWAGRWDEWRAAWEGALSLVPLMSRAQIAPILSRLLREDGMTYQLATTITRLPGPWDEALSLLYLQGLRKHVSRIFSRNREESDPWMGTPRYAAERMPVVCLGQASVPQPEEVLTERVLSDGKVIRYEISTLRSWREELEKYEETLELRRKLVKEIPL